jgi:hypothetical protein
MEVFSFHVDPSEKAFNQEILQKLTRNETKVFSTQILFITKSEEEKLKSMDLNNFSFHKILQGLESFGEEFDPKLMQFPAGNPNPKEQFFVQFSDTLGARFDSTIPKIHFGKTKSPTILHEINRQHLMTSSGLFLQIVLKKLEDCIQCFVFGTNAEKHKPLTRKQTHHFLLCLHAFTTIK